jgi:hypothetical protein
VPVQVRVSAPLVLPVHPPVLLSSQVVLLGQFLVRLVRQQPLARPRVRALEQPPSQVRQLELAQAPVSALAWPQVQPAVPEQASAQLGPQV